MKLILFVIFIFLPSFGFASTSVGNGGMLVACSTATQSDLSLLDFVEAKLLWNLPEANALTSLASQPSSETTIVTFILNRLEKLDPKRASRLKKEYASFYTEAFFIQSAILTPTQDDNAIALPVGCSLMQAVIQVNPELPGEKRFNISQIVWDLLNPLPIARSGLIMHELLYREAIANGQTTSKKTRYLNAFLFSEQIESSNVRQYQAILKSTGFPQL